MLVADGSSFSRGVVRNALELDGYAVKEAADCTEALSRLEQNKVMVVVTSTVLPSRSNQRLVDEMRKRPEMARIPIVALGIASSSGDNESETFDVCLERFERASLLESVARIQKNVTEDADTAGGALIAAGRR